MWVIKGVQITGNETLIVYALERRFYFCGQIGFSSVQYSIGSGKSVCAPLRWADFLLLILKRLFFSLLRGRGLVRWRYQSRGPFCDRAHLLSPGSATRGRSPFFWVDPPLEEEFPNLVSADFLTSPSATRRTLMLFKDEISVFDKAFHGHFQSL